MDFEFDPAKSAANLAKHGIDFEAAQALWRDERRITIPSDRVGEMRDVVVGVIGGRLWAAAITYRKNEEAQYDRQDDQRRGV